MLTSLCGKGSSSNPLPKKKEAQRFRLLNQEEGGIHVFRGRSVLREKEVHDYRHRNTGGETFLKKNTTYGGGRG